MKNDLKQINREHFDRMRREGKPMKAIGYVCGMYIDQEGKVVDEEMQEMRIREFAAENNLEIETVFEDMDEGEIILQRPGLRKMLSLDSEARIILVDRVWCLGRTRSALQPLLERLDGKGLRLEAATTCFDVTSQFVRFWYDSPVSRTHDMYWKSRELQNPVPKARIQ